MATVMLCLVRTHFGLSHSTSPTFIHPSHASTKSFLLHSKCSEWGVLSSTLFYVHLWYWKNPSNSAASLLYPTLLSCFSADCSNAKCGSGLLEASACLCGNKHICKGKRLCPLVQELMVHISGSDVHRFDCQHLRWMPLLKYKHNKCVATVELWLG